ncbi:hypothetical protein AZF37_07865 [endosymbiont 'TC1' of Trimyema compressum]|nr:hypothetical protein AZF37_07865 [endosymbiont 'TC1' of Trimyema compressum]
MTPVKKFLISEYLTILLSSLMLFFCLLNWMIPALITLCGALLFLFLGPKFSGVEYPLNRQDRITIRRIRKKKAQKSLKTITLTMILVGIGAIFLGRNELSYITFVLAVIFSIIAIVIIGRSKVSKFSI